MFLHLTANEDLSGTHSLKDPFFSPIIMVEAVAPRMVPPQLHPTHTRM